MKEEITRRGFVAAAAGSVALGSVALLPALPPPGSAKDDHRAWADNGDRRGESVGSKGDVRYGMLVRADKCIDCGACLRACHRQNGLDEGLDFIAFPTQVLHDPARVVTVPVQCMHCTAAPCVSVCPTGASFVGEGGIVEVDEHRCIGCKYCMAACPYQARVHNPRTGTVDKCRFCASKVADSDELMITCVQACINHVRVFGDLNDPESEVAREIERTKAKPLADGLTQASIYYVR